jgi:DNA-binding NarL/FixJ family response regulator
MAARSSELRILIAENNADLVATLRLLLECEPEMRVLGAARSGRELLRLAGELDPNAFIVDFSLDDGSSLPVVTQLRGQWPQAVIVIFTGYRNPVLNEQCRAAGADAVVVKTGEIEELTTALRSKAAPQAVGPR